MQPEENDSVLARKELIRQFEAMRRRCGDENFNRALAPGSARSFARKIQKMQEGELLLEKTQAEMGRLSEELNKVARGLAKVTKDSPLRIEASDEKAVYEKPLSETAQLLVFDSVRAATRGVSAEDWIIEVLRGHSGDMGTQMGCLSEILELWRTGPWAWAQSTESSNTPRQFASPAKAKRAAQT